MAAFALRRADATRALSGFTVPASSRRCGAAGRRPLSHLQRPLRLRRPDRRCPSRPTAPLRRDARGVQERRRARGRVAPRRRRVPEARLVVVGRGSRRPVVDELVRDFPGGSSTTRSCRPTRSRHALDEATVLVLPSWPEGLGRVVIEAFARGRASWRRRPAASSTSSRTASRVCSSRRGRRDALVEALLEVLPTVSSRPGSVGRRRSGTPTGTTRPRTSPPRYAELVDRTSRRDVMIARAARVRHADARRRPSGARADARPRARARGARSTRWWCSALASAATTCRRTCGARLRRAAPPRPRRALRPRARAESARAAGRTPCSRTWCRSSSCPRRAAREAARGPPAALVHARRRVARCGSRRGSPTSC